MRDAPAHEGDLADSLWATHVADMADNTMTLGHGLDALRSRIGEADVEKVLAAIRLGLEAVDTVRGVKDSGTASLNYIEVPNYSVRLAAAKLLLDIKFPKDKATKAKVTVNFPTSGETMSETALKAIAERYTAELPRAVPHPVV